MEQIAAAEDEKSSAFSLPQAEIDRLLRQGSPYQNSAFRIEERFHQPYPIAENLRFLRQEYGQGGWTFILSDGTPAHVWCDRRGIGISLHGIDHTAPDMLLAWPTVEKRLRFLVLAGQYLSPDAKEQYIAWSKARQAAVLQTAQASLHRPGYTAKGAKEPDGQLTLEGLMGDGPTPASPSAQGAVPRVSQEDIDTLLLRDWGIPGRKQHIAKAFQSGKSDEELADYLRSIYNIQTFREPPRSGSCTLANGVQGYVYYVGSGMRVEHRGNGARREVSYLEMVGHIRALINDGRYLDQASEKPYELGYGHLGNGLTVWNKLEEVDHDYRTVAHIGSDGSVVIYDKELPQEARQAIEQEARQFAEQQRPSKAASPVALYKEALDLSLKEVRSSSLYSFLRDPDASPQDAEEHIGEALDGLAEGWKAARTDLHSAYHSLPSFREWLVEDVFQQAYQDVPAQGQNEIERHKGDPAAPAWARPEVGPISIPVGATVTLELRSYTVESVNEAQGTVSLRDDALYEMGFPIFRTEPLEKVARLLETPAPEQARDAVDPHLRDVLREGLFYHNEGKAQINVYLSEHPGGEELAAFLAERFTGEEDGLAFSDGQTGGFKALETGLSIWTPTKASLVPWEAVAAVIRDFYQREVYSFGPVTEEFLNVDADAIRRALQDPERQAAVDRMLEQAVEQIDKAERAQPVEEQGQLSFEQLASHQPDPVQEKEPETGGVKLRSIVIDLTARPEPSPAVKQERHDYQIADDALGEGGPKAKFRANIAAIRLLKEIEAEGRLATPEEQEVMAQYVGWGGLSDAFRDDKPEWAKEYAELKGLLTEEEYRFAKGSTLNAHYTAPVVIKAMYEALERMGFRTGNVLEPACGVGNFLGLVPDGMKGSKLYGVELDSITGRLASQLYQNANITVSGFEKTAFPDDFFDLAISNVPFGDYKVADRRYDKHNLLIHDYFFVKSLDKVRPGGLVAYITSNGTLDKKNPAVRRLLAQKADLLGAIRLPNNAFKRNAGTEVTTDIVFLQKRDRAPEQEPEWVELGETADGVPLNRYFAEHPEMVLGTMRFDKSMYGDERDTTCEPIPGADLAEQLAEATQRLQMPNRELFELVPEVEPESQERPSIPADPAVRNFSFALVNGEIYFRENSLMTPVEVGKTPAARIRGLIELRDCTRKLIDLQMGDADAGTIRQEQQRLNRLYDGFTAQYGLINSLGNKQAFEQDSSYCLLCSLEVLDDQGRLERKADMFTKRTIQKARPVTSVDTATEALAVSIGERACVDLAYMAQLMGGPDKVEQVVRDLKGIIFKDPATGPFDLQAEGDAWAQGWQTADAYLSGNVREKLAAAREAAGQFPEFSVNVEMLEQVQPQDLTASEIDVRLGADWIDPRYYQQFMAELLKTPQNLLGQKIAVEYSAHTHEWHIKGKVADSLTNSLVYATYGTKRRNAYTILEDSLNLRDSRVYDTITDAEGKEKRVLNGKETALVQQRQEAMKEAFQEWLWKDPQRRQELCEKYNTIFNAIRPREFDGSHIRFVGMSPEITLRPHQRNAVAHILYGHNALLAHCVGAGKTFEMVAAAMESKRLGLCRKSLFVVPNHLTEQWGSEFLQLYPGANILVATKRDFEPANRKKFCSRIATGDYDAIIIGHSQFEKIPLSAERQRALLNQQIDEIVEGIQEAKAEDGERYTIKQLEKTRKGLEAKLEKLKADEKKDRVVTFEELGVDRLFVDEAHNYKNLYLYTKMRNVAGIGQTDAQKSSDMYAKCRYMDELTGGRGVTFATGTPISNSMTELYTMMRYLQMGTLEKMGLEHFDSWASAFGEKVTAIELNPTGTGFRAKTRFAKFFNLPELISLWKEAADIQTADMLKLPIPEAEYTNVVTKPTGHQKEMVADLGDRAEAVHRREVEPYVDNMLKITSDGRKLALDQRLIDEQLPDDPDSKVNAAVQNILQVWRDTADTKGAQLVFSDLSTPHYDGTFNVYDDIKNKLIAQGVPAGEIAYIHDANTEAQKAELFAKVRRGQVRVLLGSTSKMGAGTNVQDRLAALHHLDCPWRPADIEQREGRILRQGNQYKQVKIYKYVTEGTFDAYNWSIVEAKQKFIGQVMTSKSPARSCEDVDETALSYAEVKALATGDPRIKEKTELETEVAKLKLLKANHDSQRYELEDRLIKYFPQAIRQTEGRIKGLEADLDLCRAHPVQGDLFRMEVKGHTYTERKDAGAALIAACKQMTDTEERVALGEYRGFLMTLWIDEKKEAFVVSLKAGEGITHSVELGTDEVGNIARIANALDGIEKELEGLRDQLANLNTRMETTRQEAARPFAKEEELKTKSARLAVLNVELNMDNGKGDAARETEGDEPGRPDGKPSIRKMLRQFERTNPAPAETAQRDRETEVTI